MHIYVENRIKISLELKELSIYRLITLDQITFTERLILWRTIIHMLSKMGGGGVGVCDFNTKMSYRSLNETKGTVRNIAKTQ